MAKRYHQSKKDRMHERAGEDAMLRRHMRKHRGEELHEARMEELGSAYYDSYDSRRALERRDFEMINEDHHAVANLPQQVVMRSYPKPHYEHNSWLDDTISGIDEQMNKDNRQMQKHLQPDKY